MKIPSQVTTSRNGTFHGEQLFRTLDVGELLWKPDLPSSRITTHAHLFPVKHNSCI
jgi:hypothetical protein